MARIIVCGYMIRHSVAGNVMAFFPYLYGLTRLGHDVLYLEESGWPESCYHPVSDSCGEDPGSGIENLRSVMSRFGVRCPIAYLNRSSGSVTGLSWFEVQSALRDADLLLNVGGVCWLDEFRTCRRRALVDMDPFFTQIGTIGVEGIEQYHAYFTYGANIGIPGCRIPSNGLPWVPTLPPAVVDMWRRPDLASRDMVRNGARLTTVANWSAYGGVTYDGEEYGQKDREFLRLAALPAHVGVTLELALGGADEATTTALRAAGWAVRDALAVSLSVPAYQEYVASSLGEFSVAKHAYVKTWSGWFSDRSVCYLACGRPVVLQDCGFSEWLRIGCGVLAFSSLEDAAAAIERVRADFETHSRAAVEIASQIFGYERVLSRLVETSLER